MSEFSQSFHLRGSDPAQATAILRAAGVAGIVVAPKGGWTTLVPDLRWDQRGARAAAVGRASLQAPLVHWDFAEDHGIRVALYVRGERRGQIDVSFETARAPRFDRAAFAAEGLLTDAHAEEIAAALARRERSYLVAERLGLPWYRWVDYESAERGHEQGQLPGSLRIGADGAVSEVPVRAESPAPVHTPDWAALATDILQAWRARALVDLAAGEPSQRLIRDLAALLGSYPGPSALERFLFEHDEVLEVHGPKDQLAQAYAMVLRARLQPPERPRE